jgi:DNA modification methylase
MSHINPDSITDWRIDNADCIDVMRSLPDDCIDAVVADPPYGINYKSKRGQRIANDDAPFIWWIRDAS